MDYWDQLGWKDSFAKAAFSRRQSQYAKLNKSPRYTPQMIVGNKTGRGVEFLNRRLKELADDKPKFSLKADLSAQKGKVKVSFSCRQLEDSIATEGLEVTAVLFQKKTEVKVTAGENKGKTLVGACVARDISKAVPVADCLGKKKAKAQFVIPEGVKEDNLGVVLLLENPKTMTTHACQMFDLVVEATKGEKQKNKKKK